MSAVEAVGPETLVAGLLSGALVFIQHTCGRQFSEITRHEHVHSGWIHDIASHEDVMITASKDMTARVWSVSTRKSLAVLGGYQSHVRCAAVNSRYIAAGSRDTSLRLYANGAGFPLISILDGLHANWFNTAQFISSNLILSGSWDGTMCFTEVSSLDARPIARLSTKCSVFDTAITAEGQIAYVGYRGAASVCAQPRTVVDAGKEIALTTFSSAAVILRRTCEGGESVAKDSANLCEPFLPAANSGDMQAPSALGDVYPHFEGVANNTPKEHGLLHRSAGGGHAGATCNTVIVSRNGTGAAKDSGMAREFCCREPDGRHFGATVGSGEKRELTVTRRNESEESARKIRRRELNAKNRRERRARLNTETPEEAAADREKDARRKCQKSSTGDSSLRRGRHPSNARSECYQGHSGRVRRGAGAPELCRLALG